MTLNDWGISRGSLSQTFQARKNDGLPNIRDARASSEHFELPERTRGTGDIGFDGRARSKDCASSSGCFVRRC